MTEIREGTQHESSAYVALSGNRLGNEIKKDGASFALSDIFDIELIQGNDRFTEIYIKTEDDNIYRLDNRGDLTDAKESQKTGILTQASLKTEGLERQILTVGKPFFYRASHSRGRTPRIIEIVPVVAHRIYMSDAIRQITNGRTSTIKEDFQQMLPPQKIGERPDDLRGKVGPEDLEELKRIRAANDQQTEERPQATPPPVADFEKGTIESKDDKVDTENTEQENQGSQNVESKELEQTAAQLAKLTRKKGMGILLGKFPQRLCNPSRLGVGLYTSTGDFIQGEQWDKPRDQHKGMQLGIMISRKTPKGLRDRLGMIHAGYEHIQIWTASNYEPPLQIVREQVTKEYKKKELFGLRTKTVRKHEYQKRPTDTLCSYNGKHGEPDWIQYDYFMPVDNKGYPDLRPLHVNMSIVVPPDIAALIDKQVDANVYFPDAFFKALYPDTVAPTDLMHDIKRVKATQLQTVDLRQKIYKEVLRPYPQPIPY